MRCDPTQPICPQNCQNLINNLYTNCENVCLPDGYFFDPLNEYFGCFEENSQNILIGVQRCGCNNSNKIFNFNFLILILIFFIIIIIQIFIF